VLFAATESADGVVFEAYDPNTPAHPVALHYDRAARRFRFPATNYWAGGPLSVTEAYADWPY
jgi:hypothetical protein